MVPSLRSSMKDRGRFNTEGVMGFKCHPEARVEMSGVVCK